MRALGILARVPVTVKLTPKGSLTTASSRSSDCLVWTDRNKASLALSGLDL